MRTVSAGRVSAPARLEKTERMQSFAAREIGRALAAAMVTFAASIGAADHVDSPGHGVNTRVHEARAFEAGAVDELGAQPWRTHFGRTDVYIPTFFEPKDGAYDLIVHFHGLAAAQEANVERSGVNAVIASVNLGIGSGPYEDTFKEGWTFPNLVKVIDKAVARSGRAKGARPGRIALSAWSAGYGSVSAILRVPGNASRIDAVLLADGLHSDYTDEKRHVVDDGPLGKYLKVAQQAMRGEKLFALTHSSILTTGYANTTETIGELIKLARVEKEVVVADGPRDMSQTYQADRGDFHVKGYLGTDVKAHINHIWGMSETLYPYLRERWSR
jgi:hypothetical protein